MLKREQLKPKTEGEKEATNRKNLSPRAPILQASCFSHLQFQFKLTIGKTNIKKCFLLVVRPLRGGRGGGKPHEH